YGTGHNSIGGPTFAIRSGSPWLTASTRNSSTPSCGATARKQDGSALPTSAERDLSSTVTARSSQRRVRVASARRLEMVVWRPARERPDSKPPAPPRWKAGVPGGRGVTRARQAGDLVFVSGQMGTEPDGRDALEKLAAAVEDAEASLDDVVDVISFHT